MPKRLKKPARPQRPSDPNQWAHSLVQESTAEREPEAPMLAPDFKTQLSAYMTKLGQKGGTVSGRLRKQNLTPDQRQEIATKAARARWAKEKRERSRKR